METEPIITYDANGKILSYKNAKGFWYECSYDKNGHLLTFKDSSGVTTEYTRDENGNEIAAKNSLGQWSETINNKRGDLLKYKGLGGYLRQCTYDDEGRILTDIRSGYQNEHGVNQTYEETFNYDTNGRPLSSMIKINGIIASPGDDGRGWGAPESEE